MIVLPDPQHPRKLAKSVTMPLSSAKKVLGHEKFGSWGDGPAPIQKAPLRRSSSKFEEKSKIFDVSEQPATKFKKLYERGDLPVIIRHGARSVLEWMVSLDLIDVAHYLPIFVDGIREKRDPYRFVALEGTFRLIRLGGDRILPAVPDLIYPLKSALDTRDADTMLQALRIIQALAMSGPRVGEALVPYYKQLLTILNAFKAKKRNLGDKMDYAQLKMDGRSIGETIEDTLVILEQCGGADAFVNIKYIIPTYESCGANFGQITSSLAERTKKAIARSLTPSTPPPVMSESGSAGAVISGVDPIPEHLSEDDDRGTED